MVHRRRLRETNPVIAEIITAGYDVQGKPIFRPRKKRFRYYAPTFPMGSYVSQPLAVHCRALDYWMPPEEIEKHRPHNPGVRDALPLFCEWSFFWIKTRPLYVRNRVRRFLASRRCGAAQQVASTRRLGGVD
jgi:hypothetical protein